MISFKISQKSAILDRVNPMIFFKNRQKSAILDRVNPMIFVKIGQKSAIGDRIIFIIILHKWLKILHLSKICSVFNNIHFYFQDLLYIWWFCRRRKKLFCNGIKFRITFNPFLANQIWLTYGDSEKDWKTHEIAMKNGNFINAFLVKACSIIVRRVKSQSTS